MTAVRPGHRLDDRRLLAVPADADDEPFVAPLHPKRLSTQGEGCGAGKARKRVGRRHGRSLSACEAEMQDKSGRASRVAYSLPMTASTCSSGAADVRNEPE